MVMETDLIRGIIMAAAAFITVIGIIFALSVHYKYLGKLSIMCLLLSIVSGVAAIFGSLAWFSTQEDWIRISALGVLSFQYLSGLLPLVILFFKISDRIY